MVSHFFTIKHRLILGTYIKKNIKKILDLISLYMTYTILTVIWKSQSIKAKINVHFHKKTAPIYRNVKLWCCEARPFYVIGSRNLAYRY